MLLALVSLFMGISVTAASLADVKMYVDAAPEAGLEGRVKISFTSSGSYTSKTYSGTIYLPGSADPSALKLSWENPGSVTVKATSGSTTYQSGSTPIPAVNGSVSYTVSYGGSSAKFTIKTLRGSSEVAGLFLNIDESKGTISAMNGDSNHETSCYGSVDFEGVNYFMSIKGRGNYTWFAGEKKPYNMTLYKAEDYDKKKSATLIPDVKAKKWSLLANYADSTLLRNKVGYDLADQLGIGLPSRFIDVWMNGQYLGNYLLTPKNDYQASDGGYFLELDNKTDNADPQFSLNGLVSLSGSTNMITVKDVGDDAVAAGLTTADIKDWMQEMLNAVLDTQSEDYLNYIDLDSWAKMYLLHELYKNYDILSGSIFMYRNGLTDADKLYAGPVWDLDNALGRTQTCSYSGISSTVQMSGDGWYIDLIADSTTKRYTSLLQFMGKHKSFMERVYAIYNEYKASFDDVLPNVERLTAMLTDSANMNFAYWNVNQTKYNNCNVSRATSYGSGSYKISYVATNSWATYLQNLRAFLTARLKYLSDQLTVTPPTGSITGALTLQPGDTLTLTASVDGSGLAYRWESSANEGKSWVTMPSAEATYSVTATESMNGRMYRCAVTKTGTTVSTTRVAKAATSVTVTLSPVTVSVQHQHHYTATVTPPTCTEKGYTTYTCHCGDTYTADEVDETGHHYVEYARTPATYHETGMIYRRCADCTAEESEILPVLEPIPGDVNMDGYISIMDVTALLKFLSGSPEQQQSCLADGSFRMDMMDLDESGFVSIIDVTLLLQKLASITKE